MGKTVFSIKTKTLVARTTLTNSFTLEKAVNKCKIAVKVINHYGDEMLKVYEA